MNFPRLAYLALPAALSLAACSGGSAGVVGNPIGTGGQQANFRFVNGSPDIGSVDFYWQATGAASPTAPASSTTAGIRYAIITPFVSESPTAGTVIVRAAGSSASSPALDSLSVPVPQLAANAKYSIVLAGTGTGNHRLLIFQDFDYTQAAQYRVHDAALAAPSSLAYSTAATNTSPGSSVPYNGSQVANAGGNPVNTPAATYTAVQPAGPIGNASSDPAFVIGPNTGGPTFTVLDSLNADALFASGATTQPDTSGALNFPNTAGTSLFAIDCTPASVAAFRGVQCNSGIALIGTFDTL